MRKHSVNTTTPRVCGVSDCMQRIVHFVLTAFFAMFIGLVVFVIISLGQPLSGPRAIDSGPYQLVLDRLIDLK